MKLLPEEKETIISYDEKGKEATVYTCNKALIKSLNKKCEDHPGSFILYRFDEDSSTFKVPKKYVRIGTPKRISDSERRKKAERLQGIRSRK